MPGNMTRSRIGITGYTSVLFGSVIVRPVRFRYRLRVSFDSLFRHRQLSYMRMLARYLVLQVEHKLFENRAQAARACIELERLLRDRPSQLRR